MSTIRDAHGREHLAAGAPASAGGQFARQSAPGLASELPVVADTPELVEQQDRARSRAIALGIGYIPATSQLSMTDPRHARAVQQWHDQAKRTAEFDTRHSVPFIPEDWGETLAGRSSNGLRRMGRRSYKTKDGSVAIRTFPMTRIRSYAAANGEGKPFDVPVEITVDGKPMIGQVRVTSHGGGVYTARPMGFPPAHTAELTESMQAMLESRRPTQALESRKRHAAKHNARIAAAGVKLTPVHSSFITAIGYNAASGEAIVELDSKQGPKRYSYKGVTRDEWQRFRTSESMGSAYSSIIKYVNGVARNKVDDPRDEVQWCEACSVAFTGAHQHLVRTSGVNRDVASDRSLVLAIQYDKAIQDRIRGL